MLEDAVGGALAFAEQQQEDLEGLIKILKTAQVKPCPIQISKKNNQSNILKYPIYDSYLKHLKGRLGPRVRHFLTEFLKAVEDPA